VDVSNRKNTSSPCSSEGFIFPARGEELLDLKSFSEETLEILSSNLVLEINTNFSTKL
jgi:hypothetical protein